VTTYVNKWLQACDAWVHIYKLWYHKGTSSKQSSLLRLAILLGVQAQRVLAMVLAITMNTNSWCSSHSLPCNHLEHRREPWERGFRADSSETTDRLPLRCRCSRLPAPSTNDTSFAVRSDIIVDAAAGPASSDNASAIAAGGSNWTDDAETTWWGGISHPIAASDDAGGCT